MLEAVTIIAILGTLGVLACLAYIDLKYGLLPNEFVLALAVLGTVFHLSTVFKFAAYEDMFLGAFIGGAILYLIRAVANAIYRQDTLGLGDVKLMAAAGLWLGPYHIMLALAVGAAAGLVHGLLVMFDYKRNTGKIPDLNRLSIPAGPGFIVGFVAMAVYKFQAMPSALWDSF